MDKLKELLKAVGFDAETIKKITAEKAEFDVEEIAETVLGNIKAHIESTDPEFVEKIRESVRGELLTSKERKLIALGLITKEQYDALPKKNRFDAALDFIKKQGDEKKPDDEGKTPDQKDTEIGRLNTEIQKHLERIKALEEVELPAAKNEAVKLADGYRVDRAVEASLTGMKDRKLILDVERTRRNILSEVSEQYDLVWDAKKNSVVVKKKGEDVLAYHTKDRSKPLTLQDVVLAAGDTAGLFAKNNGAPPPAKGGEGKGEEKKPKFELPGMAKARAAVEAKVEAEA